LKVVTPQLSSGPLAGRKNMKTKTSLAILVIGFAVQSKSQDFQRYVPQMIEVDSGKTWFVYDSAMSRDCALVLNKFLFPEPKQRGRRAEFFAIPRSSTYLASIGGQQLAQLQIVDTTVRELARSTLVEGSWLLHPVFFTKDTSVFIMAEFGEEHSEGFLAFDLIGGKLHQLGQCAFVPVDPKSGDYARPSDFARVKYNSKYYIDFSTDVVFNPMSTRETKLTYKHGKPFSFRFDADSVVRIN
jgi:hypothetical protein